MVEALDLDGARRSRLQQKRVNVDFPLWMVERLDHEATRLGVTRQSIIKVWLAERLEHGRPAASSQADSCLPSPQEKS
ncbi:type II toxin-antitoxin system BrnA family antitoxin [Synechococcus sp. RSCCF101]|uniref:type II toxin-antitoxin system BrnA family antitoxin n=1 Tax=Synechococcus sp. RSCCF101 TaxID=2511069 RepID=UPI001CDA4C93|nr:BrnA antitoxin family protein [Synechococcus sp. RSCCF101]